MLKYGVWRLDSLWINRFGGSDGLGLGTSAYLHSLRISKP